MGFFSYDINKYPPKEMMTIPLIVLVIALIILGINMAHTGMPVTPGIDFAGGTAVTLFTADSKETIQSYFTDYPILEVGDHLLNAIPLDKNAAGNTLFDDRLIPE